MGNEEKRSSVALVILIVVVIIFGLTIVAGAGYLVLNNNTEKSRVEVPNLYGMPLVSAQNELLNRGVYIEVVGEKYSNDVIEGLICWQSPLSGSILNRVSTIKVMLSKGKEPIKEIKDTLSVTVPSLKGFKVKEAIDKLYTLNLKIGKIEEKYSTEMEKGKIIESDPKAGSIVTKGTQINIVKSLGKKPIRRVKVPNVTNMKVWKAKKILSSRGLKVREVRRVTTEYYENTVMSQNPAAGESISAGSTVTLIVADVLD